MIYTPNIIIITALSSMNISRISHAQFSTIELFFLNRSLNPQSVTVTSLRGNKVLVPYPLCSSHPSLSTYKVEMASVFF